MLHDVASNEYCFSKKYELKIIDRVGGGHLRRRPDLRLLTGKSTQDAVEFAVAAPLWSHPSRATKGNMMTVSEVEKLAGGDGSGPYPALRNQEGGLNGYPLPPATRRISSAVPRGKRGTKCSSPKPVQGPMRSLLLQPCDRMARRWAACRGTRPCPSTRALTSGPTSAPTTSSNAARLACSTIGKDPTGIVVADGVKYELGQQGPASTSPQGTKEVTFASADPEHPAKFYMVSAPAHCSYETRLIKMADANHRPLGSVETGNCAPSISSSTRMLEDLPAEHGDD